MTKIIIIFFVLQTINVMLNTAKALIMAKTNNPHASAFINAITFGFYTIVVKQIATLDLTITVVVTIVTNLLGVYLTYWIVNKMTKDKLWRITVTYLFNEETDSGFLINDLKRVNISFTTVPISKGLVFDIYSYTQQESLLIKDILKKYPVKYCVIETKREL